MSLFCTHFAMRTALLLGFLLSPSLVRAQMSLEDIKGQLEAGASELDEVDTLLADPDQNRRIAAMQLLLKSGNPLFERRAREAGLLSSDPDMRVAALKAVLEAGNPFKITLNLGDLDEDLRQAWSQRLSGEGPFSDNGRAVTLTFQIGGYNESLKCYPLLANSNVCALVLAGSEIALPWTFYSTMNGLLRLDESGQLVGEVSYSRGGTVSAVASLID
jgi:hypothetical protein